MTKLKLLFRDERQFRIFIILCLSTLFNFALVGFRLHQTDFDFSQIQTIGDLIRLRGTTSFIFLLWNLFLAWIPFLIALSLEGAFRWTKSKILIGLLLISWLLFFPNAPYIITDLLHLKSRQPIPFWYDLMLILSFAWTGLMLGYMSLYEVQLFLKKRISSKLSWLIAMLAMVLCGFGIYLGRFLRWNSWDILTDPLSLFNDVFISLSLNGAFNITAVISGFLILGYLTLTALIHDNSYLRKT